MSNYSSFAKEGFLVAILTFIFTLQIIAQNTYYVSPSGNDANDGSSANPWLTIQGAINNSLVSNGDIIIVRDGTYNENVDVTKEVTIRSENGYLSTTVNSPSTTHSVFLVTASNVTIDGFTTYGATSVWIYSGIRLYGANNCTIKNNRCGLDASHQNWLAIMLNNSDNNIISNNIMSFNKCYGINIRGGSDNNLISNNQISNNGGGGYGGYGIQNCESSVLNKVRNNSIENNETWGVRIITSGINLGNNDENDMGNNTIKNNLQYDIYNETSAAVNAYYNYWGSGDATIIDSHLYDNEENGSSGEVYFTPWLNKTFYVSNSGDDANDGSSTQPWLTIQGAINNASVVNGDTIIVRDGTYDENVSVTKEVVLKSENGYTSTIVHAVSTNQSVFEINGINNVTIEGFTAYGATSSWNNCGVKIVNSNNCTINNNRCGYDNSHYNWKGIQLWSADNSTISNNICNYNGEIGIQLYSGSDYNTLSNNTTSNNSSYGIQTDTDGSENTGDIFRGNTIENNGSYGVFIKSGSSLDFGTNDLNNKGNNTIQNNDGGSIQFYNGTTNVINGYYNYWGSTDASTIDSHIYDNEEGKGEVFFNPWLNDPLPVELITFTANVNKNTVVLNWQTATEVNNYGFSVERLAKSFDTDRNEASNSDSKKSNTKVWESINFIEGHGNSNSPKFYKYTDKTVNSGKYLYRLKQIDIDGGFEYSETLEVNLGVPAKFLLLQNYPNPFNPTTTIKYSIPLLRVVRGVLKNDKSGTINGTTVQLKVYDILGNEVSTLVNEEQQPGVYEVTFDASKLASGIYFYKLELNNFIKTRKMILIK